MYECRINTKNYKYTLYLKNFKKMISFKDCFKLNLSDEIYYKKVLFFTVKENNVYSKVKMCISNNILYGIKIESDLKVELRRCFIELKKILPTVFDKKHILYLNNIYKVYKNKEHVYLSVFKILGKEEADKLEFYENIFEDFNISLDSSNNSLYDKNEILTDEIIDL
ncbi:hypothetical protein CWI39_1307p0010 [Hamiltosporidium magnivora]|uniref:Uncharacterized protein n=2 Tax=Hamiltosporidium TaxID=1176354 RepID=A0A4Q9L2W0_9MICR|nr:hypothetical protein CWI39_1307p0010 [Hamiltosporidium magnivora]TBU05130.1 hypothetical protein CWI36_0671p0050 [Hamiltosporidium magnivora]